MNHYNDVHKSKKNLVIHIFSAPIFIISMIFGIVQLILWQSFWGLLWISLSYACFAMQGFGHKFESQKAKPFTGPLNFLKRSIVEQFYLFPKFVLSGDFWRNWKQ